MNKIEKLEKLQELKESGAINQKEFDKEKQKILEEKGTTKFKENKKVSIACFISSLILLVITIAFIVLSYYWREEVEEIDMDYFSAEMLYNDYKKDDYRGTYYEKAKEEYEELKEEYEERKQKSDFYEYGRYLTGGLCVVSLGIGIIFIDKKKNK